jgi:hypothetical protein
VWTLTRFVEKHGERPFLPFLYLVYDSTEAGHVAYSRLDRYLELMPIGLLLKSRQSKVGNPDTLEPIPVGETGE